MARLFGIDTSEQHLQEALALELVDEVATVKDLSEADMVVLAIPVDTSVDLLPRSS